MGVLRGHRRCHRGWPVLQALAQFWVSKASPDPNGCYDINTVQPPADLQGPAMTAAIHSIDASALNAPGCSAYTYLLRRYEPFLRGPDDQFAETRGGNNTGFNFLTGVGGFLQVFDYGYSGLRFTPNATELDPSLSPQLHGITLNDLRWQGRLFTVTIGLRSTQVRLTSGSALPVQTPAGLMTVAPGQSITIPTRRPDPQSTTDLARCQQVTASSCVPGDDPVAAVDGSTTAPWQATGAQATVTMRLARKTAIDSVTVTRGSTGSFGCNVETSADGSVWHVVATAQATSTGTDQFTFTPAQAQFVRLDFPGGTDASTPDTDEPLGERSVMPAAGQA